MARTLTTKNIKGSLTFWMALAAFLISLYLIKSNIIHYFNLNNWTVSDWLLFAQSFIFAGSAYIAYSTISSSRITARERATLDTILDDNKDESLNHSKQVILIFNEDPKKYYAAKGDSESQRDTLAQLMSIDSGTKNKIGENEKLTNGEAEIRAHMLTVLNRYEFYAIGLNKNLLDEEMFKRMYCSTMLKFWGICNPAVSQLRETVKKDTLFKEYETLANRWKSNSLKAEDIK
uniref:DUF4760 domain-containing protein n=1 Tax=uncultured Acinetobacter sp. TaxID=165433 RepID=UPI002614E013|nr:DUF4760 domain-containing protein [uncultured Acinetobacter sp.]